MHRTGVVALAALVLCASMPTKVEDPAAAAPPLTATVDEAPDLALPQLHVAGQPAATIATNHAIVDAVPGEVHGIPIDSQALLPADTPVVASPATRRTTKSLLVVVLQLKRLNGYLPHQPPSRARYGPPPLMPLELRA